MSNYWKLPEDLPLPASGEISPFDIASALSDRASKLLRRAKQDGSGGKGEGITESLVVYGALTRLDPLLLEEEVAARWTADVNSLVRLAGDELLSAAMSGLDFRSIDDGIARLSDFDRRSEMSVGEASALAQWVLAALDDASMAHWAAEEISGSGRDWCHQAARQIEVRWAAVASASVAFVHAWQWIRATAMSFDPDLGATNAGILGCMQHFTPLLREITDMLAFDAPEPHRAPAAPRAIVLPFHSRIRFPKTKDEHSKDIVMLPLRPPISLAASTGAQPSETDDTMVRDPVDIARIGDNVVEIVSRRRTVELRVYCASREAVRGVRLADMVCLEPDHDFVWTVRVPWREDPVLLRVDLAGDISFETLVLFIAVPESSP